MRRLKFKEGVGPVIPILEKCKFVHWPLWPYNNEFKKAIQAFIESDGKRLCKNWTLYVAEGYDLSRIENVK